MYVYIEYYARILVLATMHMLGSILDLPVDQNTIMVPASLHVRSFTVSEMNNHRVKLQYSNKGMWVSK